MNHQLFYTILLHKCRWHAKYSNGTPCSFFHVKCLISSRLIQVYNKNSSNLFLLQIDVTVSIFHPHHHHHLSPFFLPWKKNTHIIFYIFRWCQQCYIEIITFWKLSINSSKECMKTISQISNYFLPLWVQFPIHPLV